MTKARRSKKADERQRRLAEKYEQLSDYPRQPTATDNYIDAMSADSFPASDPPSFTPAPRRQRNAEK